MFDKRVMGGILLIGGTAIGAGMLALPVALAKAGFFTSMVFLFLSWIYMTFTAFLLLEANLRLPRYSNIISMVRITLGKPAEWLAWSVYLLLLYTLLSAYISGGGDLINNILSLMRIETPIWLDSLIFVCVLGAITARGIKLVDHTNRVLMILKIALYFVLFFTVVQHVQLQYWYANQPLAIVQAIPLLITAYGYSVIVPSLRSYLNDDLKKLRITILLGSCLPLLLYVLWICAIIGTVPREGEHGLISILGTPHEVTLLAARLQESLTVSWIGDLFRGFSIVSLLTAFLGVSLSLTDFLADGFTLQKKGMGLVIILILAFLPPLVVVWLNPALFILGLSYAGICVVVLMGLMPALMVWIGRYHLKLGGYQVFGGRPALVLTIFISIVIIIFGLLQLWK